VILLPVTLAAEESKGPTGYGKASFGMPLEEVQKAYPALESLGENNSLGAPAVGGPYIANYALRDQTVAGHAKPVQVELRFWKGQLWLYLVYFDQADLDAVMAHLKSQYGDPNSPTPSFPLWTFESSTVLVDQKRFRYTVNDKKLSDEARVWFVETLKQGHPDKDITVIGAKTVSPAPAQSPSPAAGTP
jgi:hypothetical protein